MSSLYRSFREYLVWVRGLLYVVRLAWHVLLTGKVWMIGGSDAVLAVEGCRVSGADDFVQYKSREWRVESD